MHTVHPEVGYQRYEGLPWRFSRSQPPRRARPAPRFAEHNDEVLAELAGMTPTEIEALREAGAILDRPRGLRGAFPQARRGGSD